MKRLLLLVLLSILGTGLPGGPASAASCVPGSLQSYVDLGAAGCSLGSVQLADFAIAPGQSFATPIDPAAIKVTPGGTAAAPALALGFGVSAETGQLFEAFFRFSASGPDLLDDSIAMSGASATGDGAVTATQDLCLDGAFAGNAPIGCSGTAVTLIAFAIEGDAALAATAGIAPAAFLDVFTDVVIDAGPSGTGGLDGVTLSFGVVPEPSVAALLAAGLGLVARLRRPRAR